MPTPDELVDLANACVKDRKIDEAIEHLEQAIGDDSRHVQAHELLAGLCFLKKDYDRAIELFRRVSLLDPKNVGVLVNMGAAYNKQKKYQEAVKILRSALAKDRRCPEAYYNLGIAQRGLNQLAMAVSAYKEVVRLRPEMAEAYVNLGNCLLEMKNHSQAILNYRKALEVKPDFGKAQRLLRRAQDAAQQSKSAISPFGRLVDMDEVEKNAHKLGRKFELSPQHRFEDRDVVHRLSKEAELSASELLQRIKDELAPAILDMSRLATEERHGRVWAAELEKLEVAARRYHLQLEQLNELTQALRKHDERIQEIAGN